MRAQQVIVFLGLCSQVVFSNRESGHVELSFGTQNPFIYGPDFARAQAPREPTWLEKYGPQVDQPFSGPLSFSHLPYHRCLEREDVSFDIAILGMPFDTAVTYRPGWVHTLLTHRSYQRDVRISLDSCSARFGPYAIRSGSRRQRETRGYTMAWGINPYDQGLKVVDCGDVRILFFLGLTQYWSWRYERFPLILSIMLLL